MGLNDEQFALYVYSISGEILPELDDELKERKAGGLRPPGDEWKSFVPNAWVLSKTKRAKENASCSPSGPRPSQQGDDVDTPDDNILIKGINWNIANALCDDILAHLSAAERQRRMCRGEPEAWKRMIASACLLPKENSSNRNRDHAAFVGYLLLELAIIRTRRPEFLANTHLGPIRYAIENNIFQPHLDLGFLVTASDGSSFNATKYTWCDGLETPTAPHEARRIDKGKAKVVEGPVGKGGKDKSAVKDSKRNQSDQGQAGPSTVKLSKWDRLRQTDHEMIQDIINYALEKSVCDGQNRKFVDSGVVAALEDFVLVSVSYIVFIVVLFTKA